MSLAGLGVVWLAEASEDRGAAQPHRTAPKRLIFRADVLWTALGFSHWHFFEGAIA